MNIYLNLYFLRSGAGAQNGEQSVLTLGSSRRLSRCVRTKCLIQREADLISFFLIVCDVAPASLVCRQ